MTLDALSRPEFEALGVLHGADASLTAKDVSVELVRRHRVHTSEPATADKLSTLTIRGLAEKEPQLGTRRAPALYRITGAGRSFYAAEAAKLRDRRR